MVPLPKHCSKPNLWNHQYLCLNISVGVQYRLLFAKKNWAEYDGNKLGANTLCHWIKICQKSSPWAWRLFWNIIHFVNLFGSKDDCVSTWTVKFNSYYQSFKPMLPWSLYEQPAAISSPTEGSRVNCVSGSLVGEPQPRHLAFSVQKIMCCVFALLFNPFPHYLVVNILRADNIISKFSRLQLHLHRKLQYFCYDILRKF